MKLYIPAPAARAMSDALWSLSRPASVRNPSDTQYLFPWIKALDDSHWLVVDTDFEINVHPLAEINGIAPILQPFVDAGELPADTLGALSALIESKRGGKLVPWEVFPQFFKDQAKTTAQMNDTGLLVQQIDAEA